jgi:hypothetical protein
MEVHNIVIAVMPEIGNNKAATVATLLLNDFRSIRFGLLVGIGDGIPGDNKDDIFDMETFVVSKPTATFGGLCNLIGERFTPTGDSNRPELWGSLLQFFKQMWRA